MLDTHRHSRGKVPKHLLIDFLHFPSKREVPGEDDSSSKQAQKENIGTQTQQHRKVLGQTVYNTSCDTVASLVTRQGATKQSQSDGTTSLP